MPSSGFKRALFGDDCQLYEINWQYFGVDEVE